MKENRAEKASILEEMERDERERRESALIFAIGVLASLGALAWCISRIAV